MNYFKKPTPENLYAQYRELSKKYHPDNQSTGSAEKFRDVKDEYDYWKQKFKADNIDIHMVARQYAELVDKCLRSAGFDNISYNLLGVSLEVCLHEPSPDIIMSAVSILQRELEGIYPEYIQLFAIISGVKYTITPAVYGFMVSKTPKDLYPKLPTVGSSVISKNNWLGMNRGKWTQWEDADSGRRGLYCIPREDALKNLPKKKG